MILPRILETEVMDTAAEATAYDAMDHAAVNHWFVRDLRAVWAGTGPVLDVGTGTALIPIELCRQVADVEVLAVDLAGSMLALARQNIAAAGLAERITLQAADAKALPFADGRFPVVMSNSIVHHVPEPGRALAEMARVVAPGGLVFVRDLVRPTSEARLLQLVDAYAGGADAHQRQMFADSLRAALALTEVRDLVVGLGYPAGSVSLTSDRHWTWVAVRPV